MQVNIKEFAERTHATPRTIRFYEEKGLLCPKRNDNGYRDYQEEDVLEMKTILALKTANLSLEDIARIVALKNRETSLLCKEETLSFLERQISQLALQIKLTQLVHDQFVAIKSVVQKSEGEADMTKVLSILKQLERGGIEHEKDN
ncbi:hypothetical protein CBF30_07440 [Vagococcus entomophilus]|uniref:HTH merR-type domain-containing protein n=1 Tax=Vagococcus entomophilus TaxID=1160095 RepID=A0A430AGN8_9ENTE|nr:hypothetical protein CBF30_07440 [Vagococcus entomophilus]